MRDPRGFALKFYTEDGNYDLVGNNTPVFFIKDAIKFPDFIHTQKRDPYTGSGGGQRLGLLGSLARATHQLTWLFGDRGIPAIYRHMNGFGSHTYQWNNAAGEVFWVKYHFKTDQGIKCLIGRGTARTSGGNPDVTSATCASPSSAAASRAGPCRCRSCRRPRRRTTASTRST